jgi:hypothetical protein
VGHQTYIEREDADAIYQFITQPIFQRLIYIVTWRNGELTCEQEVELFLHEINVIESKDDKVLEIFDKRKANQKGKEDEKYIN